MSNKLRGSVHALLAQLSELARTAIQEYKEKHMCYNTFSGTTLQQSGELRDLKYYLKNWGKTRKRLIAFLKTDTMKSDDSNTDEDKKTFQEILNEFLEYEYNRKECKLVELCAKIDSDGELWNAYTV